MNELSPEARGLIERTRDADNPAEADRQRMRARLARELGPLALGTSAAALSVAAAKTTETAGGLSASVPTAAASVQGTLLSAMGKLMAGVFAAGALGAAVMLSRPDHAERAPAQAAQGLAATPARAVVPDPKMLAPASEEEDAREDAEPSAKEAEAAATAPAVAKSAAAAKSPGRARASRPAPEPQAAPAQSASTLAAELALLERAQRALRKNDPAQALEIAAQHAARFPEGTLRPERLGVVALARCARGEDGEGVIAQLAKEAPESPLLARVRAACGGAKP